MIRPWRVLAQLIWAAGLLALSGCASTPDNIRTEQSDTQEHTDIIDSGAAGVTAPKWVDGRGPRYPTEALRSKQEGEAVLLLLIDDEGAVRRAKLLQSSGSKFLDEAALGAAVTWTFEPATKEGIPIWVWHRHPMAFRLGP